MEKTYTFEDFRSIIETLRSENGCPWDREQTHESLKPCMIEEAAEVAASIRIYQETGDDSNLCEELGDVMLQVMLHSQIASEEGRFNVEDVLQGICEKMIRRHPHVFGSVKADTSLDVIENWDEIKRKEKEKQSYSQSELLDIPIELPALMRAQKVIKKIEKKHGNELSFFDEKEEIFRILHQIEGENRKEEVTKDQIGELLYHTASLAKKVRIDAEEALMEIIYRNILEEEKNDHKNTP